LRIEEACAALTTSDMPINEIALAAGFYDQSHFSNTFKKITGMTPAAWRAASDQRRQR
jgi:AraC family transcriptional regulator